MAQNITLMGASYPDVPAVTLPKTGGGSAQFDDTSDANATAADILSGKTAYVNGVKLTGTGSGGGGTVDPDVIFVDYDGTELHTYTAAEAQALSALPANPSHTGLTAQGWNWTLAEIKSQLTNVPNGRVIVGQMYVTASGNTEIDIKLDDASFLSPWLVLAINGTVTVDWGDNSATDTMTGSSLTTEKYCQHVYAATGEYTITLAYSGSNKYAFYGAGAYGGILRVKNAASNAAKSYAYSSMVKNIRTGANLRIGDYAFIGCAGLETITIHSDAMTTYAQPSLLSRCSSLKCFILPPVSSNSTIGGYQNQYATSLKYYVTTPKTRITSVTYAFDRNVSLKAFTIPYGETNIGGQAFRDCASLEYAEIPSTVTTVGTYAFSNCVKLKRNSIAGATTLNTYMFDNCDHMESIAMPSSCNTYSEYSFRNCSALKNVSFSSGKTLGTYLFSDCANMETITLPSTLTTINTYAFNNCRKLKKLTIPSGVTTIPNYMATNCHNLKEVSLPSGVTSIGNYAFEYCAALTNIEIPSTVKTLGEYCFAYDYVLQSPTLPSALTTIKQYAFRDCHSLTKLTIPASVTAINANAFYNCYSILEYHFLPTTPPTLGGTNVFTGIDSSCVFYVPAASLNTYKTASVWSNYASRMVGE